MANMNSVMGIYPNLPFVFYPKGYPNLVDSTAFLGLKVHIPDVKSNVVEVIIKGTSRDDIIPKFYYMPSLEKITVVTDYLEDGVVGCQAYDIKNNPSKFIWGYLRNVENYAEIFALLSRINYPFNLDEVSKSTKMSDIYRKVFTVTPRLVSLCDEKNDMFSLISSLKSNFYSYLLLDEPTMSVSISREKELRRFGSVLACNAYKEIISKIPKHIKELAIQYQKVSKESDLKAYVLWHEINLHSTAYFIALPINKGFLFPIVLHVFWCAEYESANLVGTTFHGYSDGFVPENLVEQALMEIGSKSDVGFLKHYIKARKDSILTNY